MKTQLRKRMPDTSSLVRAEKLNLWNRMVLHAAHNALLTQPGSNKLKHGALPPELRQVIGGFCEEQCLNMEPPPGKPYLSAIAATEGVLHHLNTVGKQEDHVDDIRFDFEG